MLSDATLTADIIKQFAKNAVDSTMPFSFHYGTVKSTDPIEIEVEQKLILTENDLIFTTLVQDFDVDMYMEHETEETDLTHKHQASIIITSPHGDTGSITVQDTDGKHTHEYKGVKTFTVNLKLAKDEKVLLLRIQGGQKFLVLDRVRTLNDTEFTDEFEGSGSSGSSGSGSGSNSGNTSGGGSGGSTDSSGGNSGSTDSGNGGNDSGSTDNENPDTGDNGNNSGGSVSDVISVTALMTALLSLTDEQKKEIGLTGVTIDDENITDETVYSSKKTTDELNNKVDKVEGKELSSNDFTDEEKTKLSELNNYDDTNLSNKVTELESTIPSTIASEISKIVAEAPENFDTLKEMSDWITEHEDSASAMNSAIQSNKTDIETEIAERKSADTSLQNQINNKVDANHTHDDRYYTETEIDAKLSNKVDKVSGKQLSTNDYTNEDKNKLAGIAEGANKTTVDTALSTSSTNPVQNKVVTTKINAISTEVTNLGNQIASLNGGNITVYTCSTASGTTAKTISDSAFKLVNGVCVRVMFTNGNSIKSPTLNINNTGAKEIRVLSEGSILPLTVIRGNSSSGAYQWNYGVVLELYYNGTYWVAINNPVVACKKTWSSGTSNGSPAYKCYLNGWKEIKGQYYIGDLKANGKSINTFYFPVTMSDTNYDVKMAIRFASESNVSGGEEMGYSSATNYIKTAVYCRNSSETSKGISLDWMIQGY